MFPEVNALLLFGRLPRVATIDDARLRIRLAHRALILIPAQLDSSAILYLVEGSLMVRALDAVRTFLQTGEWPDPGELNRKLMVETAGPTEGARIVLGGVTALVRAVDELHRHSPNLLAVARRADRATRSACQANARGEYTWESLALLEQLQNRLYGKLPEGARSKERPTPPPRPALSSGLRA